MVSVAGLVVGVILLTTNGAQATCGGSFHGSGIIQSPNYPLLYSNNQDCTYYLFAAPGKTIVLNFQAFNTEFYYDTVEFYSGRTLVATYSGTTLPPTLNLGTSGRIRFRSDRSVRYTGFKIAFTSQHLTCGGLYFNNGIISSPNFPKPYPNNAYCVYTLRATYGHGIQIQFKFFELEGPAYDTVKVYNGPVLVGTYSGKTIPVVPLLGQTATLVFTSDYSVREEGFLARFGVTFANVPLPQSYAAADAPAKEAGDAGYA